MPFKIIDTNDVVTAHLGQLEGVETIIRYLTTAGSSSKLVREPEAKAIAASGRKLALVFENYGGVDDFVHGDIDAGTGAAHGLFCHNYASRVGAPDGTLIWFAIDTDVTPKNFERLVVPYLKGVRTALGARYRMGLYSNGMACGLSLDRGLVDAAWLAQSTAFLGYGSFRASRRWRLLQGPETTLHGLSVDTNEANGDDYGQFVPFAAVDTPKTAPAGQPEGSPVTPAPSAVTTAPAGPKAPPGPPPAVPVTLQAILDMAAASSLARWAEGWGAPIGYVKGMAAAMALLHSRLGQNSLMVTAVAAARHDTPGDALNWYRKHFEAAGMSNETAGPDVLRHVMTLLFDLGLHESGGKFCEGRDTTAPAKDLANTAEAGLFQMSWDAHIGCPDIADLFQAYVKAGDDPEKLGVIFHEGVHCSETMLTNHGAGVGMEFQRVTKASPMFAVLSAARGLRSIGGHVGHWGPIRREEVKIRNEADQLFRMVQGLVNQSVATS